MIPRTDDEILAKLKDIWKDEDNDYKHIEFSVEFNEPNDVQFRVHRMYDPPGLNLDKLMQLAEFFGTKNIDDERFAHGGCETCDYGSEYGFALTVKPDPEEPR